MIAAVWEQCLQSIEQSRNIVGKREGRSFASLIFLCNQEESYHFFTIGTVFLDVSAPLALTVAASGWPSVR